MLIQYLHYPANVDSILALSSDIYWCPWQTAWVVILAAWPFFYETRYAFPRHILEKVTFIHSPITITEHPLFGMLDFPKSCGNRSVWREILVFLTGLRDHGDCLLNRLGSHFYMSILVYLNLESNLQLRRYIHMKRFARSWKGIKIEDPKPCICTESDMVF